MRSKTEIDSYRIRIRVRYSQTKARIYSHEMNDRDDRQLITETARGKETYT